MGNSSSIADIIIGMRTVDPTKWDSHEDFLSSIECALRGEKPTFPTVHEKALMKLIDAIIAERDTFGSDVAQVATVRASRNLELSSDMVDYYIAEGAKSLAGAASLPAAHNPANDSAKSASKFDSLFG